MAVSADDHTYARLSPFDWPEDCAADYDESNIAERASVLSWLLVRTASGLKGAAARVKGHPQDKNVA